MTQHSTCVNVSNLPRTLTNLTGLFLILQFSTITPQYALQGHTAQLGSIQASNQRPSLSLYLWTMPRVLVWKSKRHIRARRHLPPIRSTMMPSPPYPRAIESACAFAHTQARACSSAPAPGSEPSAHPSPVAARARAEYETGRAHPRADALRHACGDNNRRCGPSEHAPHRHATKRNGTDDV